MSHKCVKDPLYIHLICLRISNNKRYHNWCFIISGQNEKYGVVALVFYGSSTLLRSFRAQSKNLFTLFPGKPPTSTGQGDEAKAE